MRAAIGYIRVSTAKQGRSGLGLEAQQAALAKFAEAEGFRFLQTFTETDSGADDTARVRHSGRLCDPRLACFVPWVRIGASLVALGLSPLFDY